MSPLLVFHVFSGLLYLVLLFACSSPNRFFLPHLHCISFVNFVYPVLFPVFFPTHHLLSCSLVPSHHSSLAPLPLISLVLIQTQSLVQSLSSRLFCLPVPTVIWKYSSATDLLASHFLNLGPCKLTASMMQVKQLKQKLNIKTESKADCRLLLAN